MTGLLELIALRLTGKPLAALDWRELVRVRDEVDQALDRLVNERQMPPGGDAA